MQRAANMLRLCSLILLLTAVGHAQTGVSAGPQTGVQTTLIPQPKGGTAPSHTLIPMKFGTPSPGQIELVTLEGKFADSVAKGGGRAFASWFADDAVTLNNGQPAILGLTAIAASATWDPQTYQLSWYAEGAQMGPSNDTGFTWGRYDADTKDKDGKPLHLSGRYITFWKKVAGKWKVALDASANGPPSTDPLAPVVPLPTK